MSTAAVVATLCAGVLAVCFVVAYRLRGHKGWSDDKQETVGNVIGVFVALSLLGLAEAAMQYQQGTSFYGLLASGSTLPYAIFFAGAVQGIIYEYYGQYTFKRWDYPAVERRRWLMLFLPVFWAIFMLIMQDVWAFLQYAGVNDVWSVVLTSIGVFGLLEGFNLLTHSWVYKGWANTPYALVAGWMVLTLTFVVAYNHFFTAPFGF